MTTSLTASGLIGSLAAETIAAKTLAAEPVPTPATGATIWFTGLPSAGKTTVARAVAEQLGVRGHRVELLDGDVVRETLCADLGFSRADRDRNVARIGFVAALLARHAALGLPYLEVHVATPVAECASRDVKGLYARAYAGDLRGLTGVDDPYEPPAEPDLRLDTVGRMVEESAAEVLALLRHRGLA